MGTDGEGGVGAAASSATLTLGRVDAGGAGMTGRTGVITTPLRHLYDVTVGRGDARRRRRRLRHQMKTTRQHTSASTPRATPTITTT